MADETEINRLFGDCAHGAVPAVGKCYGLDIIVDDSIEAQPEIYMDAGDHETPLHMGHVTRLMANALHGRFSAHDRGLAHRPMPTRSWAGTPAAASPSIVREGGG
jgi:Ala-tRNA(Pro) deacylase